MAKQIIMCGDQGDVRLFKVDSLPEGVEKQKTDGTLVVAHSETGHHDVIESQETEFFIDPKDPFTSFMKLTKTEDLKHLRSFDTHETINIPAGVWGIRRAREHTPEGYRMVID